MRDRHSNEGDQRGETRFQIPPADGHHAMQKTFDNGKTFRVKMSQHTEFEAVREIGAVIF